MYKRTFGIVPRTFGGFFEDAVNSGLNRLNEEVSAYSAPVNIQETDKSYDLHVMAPGLKKEEFKIQLDKQILTICYDHKEETTEENKENNWIRSEFRVRSFKRSFTLNDKIDGSKIGAKYADGILVVSLPKKELQEAPVHEIAVN